MACSSALHLGSAVVVVAPTGECSAASTVRRSGASSGPGDGTAAERREGGPMCRWLAYSGSPILIQTALYEGPNSLVNQSLHSRLGAEPTNGDGFGVGWY